MSRSRLLSLKPSGLLSLRAFNQGTPVLAFKSYGPEDIIQNGVNGYLVSDYNPKEIGAGSAKAS